MSPKMRDLIITTFLSVFLGLVVSGLMMLFLGANPISAYGQLLQFLVRDKYTFADIFVKATPLVFTALAFAFTFKANLYNIGAQGQFYMGSVAAVFISPTYAILGAGFLSLDRSWGWDESMHAQLPAARTALHLQALEPGAAPLEPHRPGVLDESSSTVGAAVPALERAVREARRRAGQPQDRHRVGDGDRRRARRHRPSTGPGTARPR